MRNKKILITGASGFVSHILLKNLYYKNYDLILTSRDIDKLRFLKKKYPNVLIRAGCLLDKRFVDSLINEVDIIYHLAGYKYVGLSETNIIQAVNGNIITTNVLLSSISISKRPIKIKIISTNKTLNIKGVYGATKFISERLVKDFEKKFANVSADIIYLSNIFNSPGSIGDIWKKNIKNNQEVKVTDPNCTRFFLTEQQVLNLLIDGKTNYKKIKALKLSILLDALIIKYNKNFNKEKIIKIGLNENEEMHEFFPYVKLPSNLSDQYTLEEVKNII